MEILQQVKEAIKLNDKETDPCEYTGEGWIAEESLATGLLCFLLFPNDSVKALIRAVNTKGDSDSIACVTGALAGARNGISSFPSNWVERIEYQKELNDYISFVLNE
ncbi:ADP-ribosylglycohydrolase family protein [Bernardetia sp. Wsw4-3y2]|uniref:ADP-ribosylglycohydrolase family protein n=1 Tax=Bernardetia sp. Wsw4-3y2 TaxID=3127471 RepID=UPI0030CDA081